MISIEELKEGEIMGVYAIHCMKSGYTYIGASTNISLRLLSHRMSLAQNSGNRKFNADYNLYGPFGFVCALLKRCNSRRELKEAEQYFIDTTEKTYNARPATYAPSRKELIHSPLGRIAYNNGLRAGKFMKMARYVSPKLWSAFRHADPIPKENIESIKLAFDVSDDDLQLTERDKARVAVRHIKEMTSAQQMALVDKSRFLSRHPKNKSYITKTMIVLFEKGFIDRPDHNYELTELGRKAVSKFPKWNPVKQILTPYLD